MFFVRKKGRCVVRCAARRQAHERAGLASGYITVTGVANNDTAGFSSAGLPYKAGPEMVIHQPGRLHQGIGGGRPHEAETVAAQALAQPLGFSRAHRDIRQAVPAIDHGLPVNRLPDKGREAAWMAFLHGEPGPCPSDCCFDFSPVSHDSRISKQTLNVGFAKSCHLFRIEAREGPPEVLSLAQDGDPGEARLKAFEYQKLVQLQRVVLRSSPLLIMVALVEWIAADPAASAQAILSLSRRYRRF